jgi:hypothetical protein
MKRYVYYLIIKNFNFINNNYLSSQTSEHNNTKNGILAWERYTMWHPGLGKVYNVAFWLGKGMQCGILAWERYTMWWVEPINGLSCQYVWIMETIYW